ncbi:hypothetical protein PPERSA_05772 [Pseudocohnilembus persalinus]|uniref:Uncharacterized protein n=1 Tax=Pseudocohnilembus persalinus TaxID=266149 RepID=A0A0V0QI82_PSEPJ|nr:hypothetical protein PPERSA_05772 [Pseudocohnilembus persalinus]|eukprot:KRX01933.1 hypothetical protein PPERSA_05772 [Pseudocohnilembus persalinus]
MGRYLTGQSQTKELQSQIYHGKRLKEFLTQYPHDKSETQDFVIKPEMQQYNPYEGFIVQFDRIYGLPQNFNKIKLFYDIQLKGLLTKPSKETSSHQTQNYSYKHKQCEINEKDLFVNINQDPSTIIYVEIWAEVINQQKNKLYEIPIQKMVGWTMIECFKCSDRQLNNGNFKLPIYNSQLDPLSLTRYGLPSILEAHLFLRIGYKNQQMI